MATNATITRYRPALYVLAALAAGYTIYYVHTTQKASSTTRAHRQPLRRRQANNRRRQRPSELQELIASADNLTSLADYPKTVWNSQRLLQEWRVLPLNLIEVYLLQQRYWTNDQTPKTLPLRKRPPPLDVLTTEWGVPAEDVKTVRQDYEETLLKTFICQNVPPRCTLVDVDGPDAFADALSAEPEELMFPHLIKTIVHLFNAGAYDSWGVRKDTYIRFKVQPPETRRIDELDPEDWPSVLEENNDEIPESPNSRPRTPPDNMDIVSESTQQWQEDENEESKREGQTLLNMLYHIAEDQARREGYIHRGVTCNSCHCSPIHGLRYKCINCFDFDLCETCEALQQHPRTHLFIKIRIPTPSYASTRRPQPLWYPGKTVGLVNTLTRTCKKTLSELSGFTESEIDALWDQFKNLASVEFKDDPLGFGWAIDRETFHKCFALWHGTTPRGRPASLVYDRLFCFYDQNKDGLVSFKEFVSGMAASKSKDPEQRLKRVFEGFDYNEDGYVCRKDVLAMFKACYVLQKERARDYFMEYEVDLLEGGHLRDNIASNHPISAAFAASYERSGPSRVLGQGKIRNANGDLIINDNQGVLVGDSNDEGDLDTIIGDLKEIAAYGDVSDITTADEISSPTMTRDVEAFFSSQSARGLEEMISSENWPPAYLKDDDAISILGPSVTLAEVITDSHRAKVVQNAMLRIKDEQRKQIRRIIRQEAVKDRADRAHFYLDEDAEQIQDDAIQDSHRMAGLSPVFQDPDSEYHNGGPATWNRITNTFSDKAFRVPPPMPADVGQEILFQVTEECINELLDPLFRLREDLCKTYTTVLDEYLEVCTPHLETFDTEYNHALAWFQLERFCQSFDEDCNWRTRPCYASLLHFLSSLEQPESENFSKHQADANMIAARLKAGKSIPYHLDYAKIIAEEGESVKIEDDALAPAKEENQPTPSLASDASHPTDLEIEHTEPTLDLHESVRIFNENDTSVEEDIAKQDLDALLVESGYSIDADGKEPELLTDTDNAAIRPLPSDPTLPQNRPNSSITTSSTETRTLLPMYITDPGQTQYVPPSMGPWSQEFTRFMCFLLVLRVAKEQDDRRGAPGRINFDEFAAIVKGRTGPDLEFLGQWIEMQVM